MEVGYGRRIAIEVDPDGSKIVIYRGKNHQGGHRVLVHLTRSAKASHHPEVYRDIVHDAEHHRQFIPHFRNHVPWLSDAEIGWRIACALAIRSQVLSSRARTRALTGAGFDLDSAEAIVAHIVAVVGPMFARPPEPPPGNRSNFERRSNPVIHASSHSSTRPPKKDETGWPR